MVKLLFCFDKNTNIYVYDNDIRTKTRVFFTNEYLIQSYSAERDFHKELFFPICRETSLDFGSVKCYVTMPSEIRSRTGSDSSRVRRATACGGRGSLGGNRYLPRDLGSRLYSH